MHLVGILFPHIKCQYIYREKHKLKLEQASFNCYRAEETSVNFVYVRKSSLDGKT